MVIQKDKKNNGFGIREIKGIEEIENALSYKSLVKEKLEEEISGWELLWWEVKREVKDKIKEASEIIDDYFPAPVSGITELARVKAEEEALKEMLVERFKCLLEKVFEEVK